MRPELGLHDREAYSVVPEGGWVLDAIALRENPSPTNYTSLAPGRKWIVRLNHGWNPDGTIPTPENYEDFAQRCARYVQNSQGCNIWIIGNETNLSGERPSGQIITPANYVRCFRLCRQAIKDVSPQAWVIPAPVAPWNEETGDWILYWRNILLSLGPTGADALAIHSYTRSNNPEDITSDAKMDAPYMTRFSNFRAYRDLMWSIPPEMRHLPVFMTEFNPLPGWENGEIIKAAADELTSWNAQKDTQKILTMILYRFMDFDRWSFSKKPNIISAFQKLFSIASSNVSKAPVSPVIPPTGPSVPKTPQRPLTEPYIDPRATERGVRVENPVREGWKVTKIQWYNEREANAIGPNHHIVVDVLDENGNRMVGIPVRVSWPTGIHMTVTQEKPGELYSADYPMSASLNEFTVQIDSGEPSEKVSGIGMGADGNPRIHTTTGVVFQKVSVEKEQEMAVLPPLTHPISSTARITQAFGARPEYYSQFKIDGVALKGHEGVDFGVPIGTNVRAVDKGRVVEVADMGNRGYGKYIKILHPLWGETVYAHLSSFMVEMNQEVQQGEVIALSGNTGNSTGPHLHLGMRIRPFNRKDGWGGYIDPLPHLSTAPTPVQPDVPQNLIPIIKEAGREFGIDWRLLVSLMHAESSLNPRSVNPRTGASGLGNIMKPTWDEWSKKVGASLIFDPRDNARVTAAYLVWCNRVAGSVRKGLWAYNWGIGNVQAERTPPQETIEFATKVIHGWEVLRAVIGE